MGPVPGVWWISQPFTIVHANFSNKKLEVCVTAAAEGKKADVPDVSRVRPRYFALRFILPMKDATTPGPYIARELTSGNVLLRKEGPRFPGTLKNFT